MKYPGLEVVPNFQRGSNYNIKAWGEEERVQT